MADKIPRDPKTPEEVLQRVSCALKNGECSLKFVRTPHETRGYEIEHKCQYCGYVDRVWYTKY